jgi:ketosteroid isomerase-like protein
MSDTATAASTDLETRIDQLESRFAIEDLIARYAKGFDRTDPELLHSIWWDDCVLDFGEAFGTHEGIEAIRAAADQFWTNITWMHHWQATPLIEIDGDRATAYVGLDCLVRSAEEGPVRVGGYYEDVFERREGVWKFARRRCDIQIWAPDPTYKAETEHS